MSRYHYPCSDPDGYGNVECETCGGDFMAEGTWESTGFEPDDTVCPACSGEGACEWCDSNEAHSRFDQGSNIATCVTCDKCWHKEERECNVAWTKCNSCENWLCLIHGSHAHECGCPPEDEWKTSPYLPQDDLLEFKEEPSFEHKA